MSLLLLFQNRDTASSPDSTGEMPLFIYGSTVPTSIDEMSLYLNGKDVKNKSLDLSVSGSLNESYVNNTNLYISGSLTGPKNKSLDLYSSGSLYKNAVKQTTLYTINFDTSSDDIPLYIDGSVRSETITLSIVGVIKVVNNIPLYTFGIDNKNSKLNLFINGYAPTSFNNNIPLYLEGFNFGSGGLISSAISLLYLEAIMSSRLNLFIKSPAVAIRNMNLFIAGRWDEAFSNIPLFVFNEQIGSQIRLFIKGHGYEHGHSMNLYLKRPEENIATLFMQGPATPNIYNIPLFINGAFISQESMDLVLPITIGGFTSKSTLYTHGF